MTKPELISFKLCPFVQRSVITLLKKKVDFDITYIDLGNPPAWFEKLSPLGKVPVLRVGDTVLFESAVINEYLDEINPPSLLPKDPLVKAQNRAWIEFGNELIGTQYQWVTAETKKDFKENQHEITDLFSHLEAKLGAGPFFNGKDFSLVDAAFAPCFMRFELFKKHIPLSIFDSAPKVAAWSRVLTSDKEVEKSVVPDFEELMMGMLGEGEGYVSKLLKTKNSK